MKSKNKGNLSLMWQVQIIFLILKLTGLLNWSWLYILMPIISTAGLALFAALIYIVFDQIRRKYKKNRNNLVK